MSKTAHWNYIRAGIKKDFERQGIVRCEKCGSGMYLSFAHRLKRRFITTDEELKTVALSCQPCHEQIEFLGHTQMFTAINEIIANRGQFEVKRYFSDDIEDQFRA